MRAEAMLWHTAQAINHQAAVPFSRRSTPRRYALRESL